VSELGREPNESTFLNAEDAEALAEVRKGRSSSASFAKHSAPSAVKMGFANHTFLVLTQTLKSLGYFRSSALRTLLPPRMSALPT